MPRARGAKETQEKREQLFFPFVTEEEAHALATAAMKAERAFWSAMRGRGRWPKRRKKTRLRPAQRPDGAA
jgi:hypothetical protein